MSHIPAPIIRHADLSKMTDAELTAETVYLYRVGIPTTQAIIYQYAFDIFAKREPKTSVPGWKHVEYLQEMIDRLQAIVDEREYRKI